VDCPSVGEREGAVQSGHGATGVASPDATIFQMKMAAEQG